LNAHCDPAARYATPPPLPAALVDRGAQRACFIVKDATGQALGYFYFEEEPGRRGGWPRTSPSCRSCWHSAQDTNGLRRERRIKPDGAAFTVGSFEPR